MVVTYCWSTVSWSSGNKAHLEYVISLATYIFEGKHHMKSVNTT